jgi:hypothetical protein
VSTPWRSDKSAGLVASVLMLLKKFEIAVPMSPLPLVKLTCVCCKAETRPLSWPWVWVSC